MNVLVATLHDVLTLDPERGDWTVGGGLEGARPTCLVADASVAGRAWCGTRDGGVFRSGDAGRMWRPVGLGKHHITALGVAPAENNVVWAGGEPSALWRSDDAGDTWLPMPGLEDLPSSSEWSFPPRPETHHVRWIACHPHEPGRLLVAIEAGALISSDDGGHTWRDRVPGGPYDTHELAIHADAPDTFRVSAGDGYYESHDRGRTWSGPRQGLDVGYMRSVAIDPGRADVVIVSASSAPRTAYVAGRSDGRIYRRVGEGPWRRVHEGWPDPPSTIAPLLAAGTVPGEFWAADERGVHRSDDGGVTWRPAGAFTETPDHLRGLAVVS